MTQTPTFETFNPSNDSRVTDIKRATDSLIEMTKAYANETPGGQRRMALAITNYEQAAMWAVKSCFSED